MMDGDKDVMVTAMIVGNVLVMALINSSWWVMRALLNLV